MNGRSVIVTGGFGVLGKAVARAFAAAGEHVARVDFAAAAPDEPGGEFLDLGGVDLTDEAAASRAAATVVAAHGSIDVLVNVAGGFVWETVADGTPGTWQRMFDMNLLTAVTMTRAALPHLARAGSARVVNLGAGAARKADAGMGAYAASKAGVHRFTEALAAELAREDITVNAVLPSIIDTPGNRSDMPGADFTEWVKPEAIADVIVFLASPASRAVSGALVPVTRGDSKKESA